MALLELLKRQNAELLSQNSQLVCTNATLTDQQSQMQIRLYGLQDQLFLAMEENYELKLKLQSYTSKPDQRILQNHLF